MPRHDGNTRKPRVSRKRRVWMKKNHLYPGLEHKEGGHRTASDYPTKEGITNESNL